MPEFPSPIPALRAHPPAYVKGKTVTIFDVQVTIVVVPSGLCLPAAGPNRHPRQDAPACYMPPRACSASTFIFCSQKVVCAGIKHSRATCRQSNMSGPEAAIVSISNRVAPPQIPPSEIAFFNCINNLQAIGSQPLPCPCIITGYVLSPIEGTPSGCN